jgi:hypothetical protein
MLPSPTGVTTLARGMTAPPPLIEQCRASLLPSEKPLIPALPKAEDFAVAALKSATL